MKKISVILPVYNGEKYLEQSIKSILNQSLTNFEFIIVNDGSVDASAEIIKSFVDPRIRYYEQENCGLVETLNRMISLSTGEFIARQDADDISLPLRFQKQLQFLDENQDVAMVGTHAEIWVEGNKSGRYHLHPHDSGSINYHLMFDNPFVHSSVMIRRSVLNDIGYYLEGQSRQFPEDYELWSRMSRKYKLANIPEVLMVYREVGGSLSRAGLNPFLTSIIRISAENLAWYSGQDIDSPAVVATSMLAHGVYVGIPDSVIKFSQIESVVNEAANSIMQRSNESSTLLEGLIEMRVSMLKYHYYQYKTDGLLGKFLGMRLERYIRAVARKIISATSR